MAEKGKLGKRTRSTSPRETPHRERKRIKLGSSDLRELSRDKIISRWKEQDAYIDQLLSKLEASGADEVAKLKESENKLQLQLQESARRENVLNMRLATKQQEMQNLVSQIHDLKQAQNSESTHHQRKLVDPAVNLVFDRMKSQLSDYKDKLEQAQSDLSAWKFTPDSVTGKKLMAKCRSLIQENQELGKQISQGRVAQLEAEIALQKKYNQEVKASQDELSEFALQLDEEVEGMQSTILQLEVQLKELKGSPPSINGGGSKSSKERTARSTPNGPVETRTSSPSLTSYSKLVSSRSQDS